MKHFGETILRHFSRIHLCSLCCAVGVGLGIQALSSSALAQTDSNAANALDQAIEAIQRERANVNSDNKRREQQFIQNRDQQKNKLAAIQAKVKAAEKTSASLEKKRNDNSATIQKLQNTLSDRQGEFGELFGAARSAANDLSEHLGNSLISAQFPNRRAVLNKMAQADTLPTVDQLEKLWFTYLQEARQQAKVVTFKANVVDTQNQSVSRDVTRIGPFVAFSNGNYLQYGDGQLKALTRQPGGGANAAAERVASYDGSGYVEGVIDPSLGSLLGLVVESPTLKERIAQGGSIGYAILIISALGIIFAVYKMIVLAVTAARVRSQARSDRASDNNPLGRVMQAYEENREADIETLQLKLDDGVLKEIPRLERGLNVIKVLSAVTPLMGLLGTVIGMINTFQAITLFGTGDPKLMAGGISQALVTTVLGLVSAIPLLLLYTFAAGGARRITQVLEEQSAGMVAEYAESE